MVSTAAIPWLCNTSTCLSLVTISSGLYFFWPFQPSFHITYRINSPYYQVAHFLGGGQFGKNLMSKEMIQLNEIEYAWPKNTVVVVCIDGGDPEYIDSGIEDGIIPNMRVS